MDRKNPLLPFAFNSSSFNDQLPLDTTPRERAIIDENAGSQYHTRKTNLTLNRPVLNRPVLGAAPSLKRKMGESFNEKDDIKRRDQQIDSEPTVVDDEYDEDDYEDAANKSHFEPMASYGEFSHANNNNKENFPYTFLPPSSPPLEATPLMSEFDFTTNTASQYNIPESPKAKDHHLLPSELDYFKEENETTMVRSQSQSYSPVKAGKHFSSDTDFGIDRFNRFKNPSINQNPSSSGDRVYEEAQIAFNKARDIILSAFEDVRTLIDLEGMSLHELPDDIKDMNNLVIFQSDLEPSTYQLYLTNNKLRDLPPSLFKFTKLNVLGIRHNKLTRIPPSIEKLVNLTDLNVGSNRLQFLPYQILDLPKLQTFRAGPNPFIKAPEDAIEIEASGSDPTHQKRFVSKMKYLTHSDYIVPSLKTICLNRLAKYDVTYQETKNWKKFTSKVHHALIVQAIAKGQYNETCSECTTIVVEPFAEVFEWWDILQNKEVPIRRQFCCGSCVKQYQLRLTNETNEHA
ncbi:uncharacterized protein RJT20DRAFT_91102 [Scheffersomyces xylosifermentans]|uniref:uncharacterized protein n=1 Tax=Scheffersomyces xylosifermentans TaxID=1304137 RepID=UPI00315D14D0